MSTVSNSGMVSLEQRADLLRSLNNVGAYAPEAIAKNLYDNVQKLLDERDQYGQDAYYDGKRADAAESDLVEWSYRIDAVRDLHVANDFPVFGRTYCKTCEKNGGEFPCHTRRALDGGDKSND